MHRRFLAVAITTFVGGCQDFEIRTLQFTEVYQQSPFEKVDVLLVVDNSGSMEPYQVKLGEDFGAFFQYFAEAEVDWQLAVTHTDALANDYGQIRGPIVTAAAPDPAALFQEVVNVGAEGGGIEAGLAAAARLLEASRSDFPRFDASISVIFVSDEEDASAQSVPSYVQRFYDLRGQRHREAFHASALIVNEIAACTPEQFAASSKGTRYIEVAQLTGGLIANLCADDLTQIGLDLALNTNTQQSVFYMRNKPDLETLSLRIDDVPVPCTDGQWWYDLVEQDGQLAPAIVFDRLRLPLPGAEVLVEYEKGSGEPADFCPEKNP